MLDLNALVDDARRCPEVALATLWYALAHSVPDRQAAAQFVGNGNQQGVEYVTSMVQKALHGSKNGKLTYPTHAFVTLSALDKHLHGLGAGEAPLDPVRVHVGGSAHWVFRRPAGRRPRISQQPDQIVHHLRHHFIVPANLAGIEIKAVRLPPTTFQVFKARGTELVRVVAGGFEDGVEPVNLAGDETGFRTRTLSDCSTRSASATRLLNDAADAHLVVMPELAIPPEVLRNLTDRLEEMPRAPLLTVAGSYHVEHEPGRWVNEATMLDHNGDVVGVHHKCLRIHVPGAYEDVSTGREICLLVGPIGVMAVVICRDFCEATIADLWHALRPDWVLVPSMGNAATQSAHERRARDLHLTAHTITVVANQPHQNHRASGVTPGGAVWWEHGQCVLPHEEVRGEHVQRAEVLWNGGERS